MTDTDLDPHLLEQPDTNHAAIVSYVSDEVFREMALNDVFGHTSSGEAHWLRTDEVLERFFDSLRITSHSLHRQLEAHGRGTFKQGDERWRRSCASLYARVGDRINELRPMVRNLHERQQTERMRLARSGDITKLRDAIRLHKLAILSEENLEPSEHDLDLWSVLGEVAAPPKKRRTE